MEQFKKHEHNMVDDNDMEEVTGGSFTDLVIKRKQFQQEKEEHQKKKEQTVFSDESGAWGSW